MESTYLLHPCSGSLWKPQYPAEKSDNQLVPCLCSFYEVEPVQDGDAPAEASYDANDDVFGESAAAAPVQEEQQQYMSYEETTTTASYQSETVQESYSYASYDAPAPVETAPQIPVIEEDNELTCVPSLPVALLDCWKLMTSVWIL